MAQQSMLVHWHEEGSIVDESNRRYTDEEVTPIFPQALSRGGHKDTISHSELVEIARSSGISPEQLQAAVDEEANEGELDAAKEKWIQRHRREFFSHLTSFCIINGFLLMVNLITGPRYLWVVWPMMGWGVGLAFHYVNTFFVASERVERGARRILRRKQRRLEWLRDHGHV